MHVAGVQYGNVLFRVRHQIPTCRRARIRVFPTFNRFDP